jgi:hypothetical protein
MNFSTIGNSLSKGFKVAAPYAKAIGTGAVTGMVLGAGIAAGEDAYHYIAEGEAGDDIKTGYRKVSKTVGGWFSSEEKTRSRKRKSKAKKSSARKVSKKRAKKSTADNATKSTADNAAVPSRKRVAHKRAA